MPQDMEGSRESVYVTLQRQKLESRLLTGLKEKNPPDSSDWVWPGSFHGHLVPSVRPQLPAHLGHGETT